MYARIENHMRSCMNDGAHDGQHIYRVLYAALDLARDYAVDMDVLVAACLLHDIGRDAEYRDPKRDHAAAGAEMAYEYLTGIGWEGEKAAHVRDSIAAHRYRNSNKPATIEAKILFDADKLDVTGAIGIARTLAYQGIVSEPLYSVDAKGNVMEGEPDEPPSFLQEYNYKLKNIESVLYTERAKAIAAKRRKAAADFYGSVLKEAGEVHRTGLGLLKDTLEKR